MTKIAYNTRFIYLNFFMANEKSEKECLRDQDQPLGNPRICRKKLSAVPPTFADPHRLLSLP